MGWGCKWEGMGLERLKAAPLTWNIGEVLVPGTMAEHGLHKVCRLVKNMALHTPVSLKRRHTSSRTARARLRRWAMHASTMHLVFAA